MRRPLFWSFALTVCHPGHDQDVHVQGRLMYVG